MVSASLLLLAVASGATAKVVKKQASSATGTASAAISSAASTTVPDYFQVTPRIFNGPTSSGVPPFLAQTNPINFGAHRTYQVPDPLETGQAIVGNNQNDNIFHYMGQLSHYYPNPVGWGVQEMPIPAGANITWGNMFSRHGARYPTSNSSQEKAGRTVIAAVKNGSATFSGKFAFLNTWQYVLGYEVMVPIGKQELFDSGVTHYYRWAHLWNQSKPLVMRTPTQERMRQSAENFAAGFGGDINWAAQNIKIEYIIEQNLYNNTLAGYFQCNNSNTNVSSSGSVAQAKWYNIYLQNATARFNNATNGTFKFTPSVVYGLQGLCPYETVALGYSAFCDLFTYDEWRGFEYSIDLSFAGNNVFQSPTGRAVGIGYVQEVLARLNHQYINSSASQVNTTLDSMPSTFPLDQNLYFDFSHDTNIAAVLAAFNFTQFQPLLNETRIQDNRTFVVSRMTPFGARMDIEVINSPRPISANRSAGSDPYSGSSNSTAKPTKYIRFALSQRTLPLYPGYPACGNRTDGWCELGTFLNAAKNLVDVARYDYSCNGNYSALPYGAINNGVPNTSS